MSTTDPSCADPDCVTCHPCPRWQITAHRIQHITYTREVKAASAEAALEIFAAGTAWPSAYDDHYGEIIQQDDPIITPIPTDGSPCRCRSNPHHKENS